MEEENKVKKNWNLKQEVLYRALENSVWKRLYESVSCHTAQWWTTLYDAQPGVIASVVCAKVCFTCVLQITLLNQKRAPRSFCAELILALHSRSQHYNLKIFNLRYVTQNVPAPTAVMSGRCSIFILFVAAFTESDFCLGVNPTVLCGYVALSRYWIS